MTTLSHSITIDRPIAAVYELAQQVERYPEFMKDYLESRIIERDADGFVVQRAALVKGLRYEWKSRVSFEKNKAVRFVHLEGPLHGMRVDWDFEVIAPRRTLLTITHRFHIHHAVPFVGLIKERWYYRPRMDDIAGRVVVSFKKACENVSSAAPVAAEPTLVS